MKPYEFLDHPADIKIRSFGNNLPEVFINAAHGMMAFLYGKINIDSDALENEQIEIEGHDRDSLLINWLSELLRLSDMNKRCYARFHFIEFDEHKIIAIVSSIKATPQDDIKAVTYHELSLLKKNDIWEATVVFDV